MRPEDLRPFRDAVPFVPFHLHLADGQVVVVRHPENIATGTGLAATVHDGDSWRVVNLLLVTAAEIEPSSPPEPRRN
jgi:hypothetical protein